jgi:hypothetical protein
MKLYDVESSAQTLLDDAAHVGSKTEDKPLNTFGNKERPKFEGFNFDDE